MLVASKAAFLDYLAVSTWILDGSSIECDDSVYLVFDLEAVRFKILERSKMSFPPLIPFYNVQCKHTNVVPRSIKNTNCETENKRHNIHMYPYFLFAAIHHPDRPRLSLSDLVAQSAE